jgi:hypothetical protein
MTQNSNLINKILVYSAKKIKAKPPAPYSILKPETNPDSPSAKSKGVRLVSAKQEINQTKNKSETLRYIADPDIGIYSKPHPFTSHPQALFV